MNSAAQKAFKYLAMQDKEPAATCSTGSRGHEYGGVFHADGEKGFVWIHECSICKDVVKRTEKRSAESRPYWK